MAQAVLDGIFRDFQRSSSATIEHTDHPKSASRQHSSCGGPAESATGGLLGASGHNVTQNVVSEGNQPRESDILDLINFDFDVSSFLQDLNVEGSFVADSTQITSSGEQKA